MCTCTEAMDILKKKVFHEVLNYADDFKKRKIHEATAL